MTNQTAINTALAYVDNVMKKSGHIVAHIANEHLQAFKVQMQEKFGVDEVTLDEPYLPSELAWLQSEYLGVLDNVKRSIVIAKKTQLLCCVEHKADDSGGQAQALVDTETNRFSLNAKQDLDAARQQAFGVKKYIWDTGGNACSICAPYDGQLFTWGEGDQPGDVHPNCQCSAEPALNDAGNPKLPNSTVTESGKSVTKHNADGSTETRTGGSRAWRNNNPGNIRAGKFADQHGAIGAAGGFAVFPDEATGKEASKDLLQTSSYSNSTIDDAIAKRSPANENDTERLQGDIQKIGGFTGDEVVGDLSDDQMNRLVDAIKQTEGWQVGTVTQGQ